MDDEKKKIKYKIKYYLKLLIKKKFFYCVITIVCIFVNALD